jgi:heme/copper-type cytochrome/quinol oxidase subunit 2
MRAVLSVQAQQEFDSWIDEQYTNVRAAMADAQQPTNENE